MGFLFNIISEVKENSNLSPYKEQLKTAVNELNKNLNKGKKGLEAVILPVMQGIKGWLEAVQTANKKVTNPLENLQIIISDHIKLDMTEYSIKDQLSNWRGFSSLYVKDTEKTEEALNGIDGNLKKEISPKFELIKHLVKNFWTSVNNDGVIRAVEALRDKLNHHRDDVDAYIASQAKGVDKALNEKFDGISQKIDSLTKIKSSHITLIRGALRSAQQLASDLVAERGGAFDTTYRDKILERFNEIKRDIEKFTKEGENGKQTLMGEFGNVQTKVGELNASVQGDLEELKMDIGKVKDLISEDVDQNLVKDALKQLEVAKGKVVGETITPIADKSAELKSHYEHEFLKNFGERIEVYTAFRNAIYGDRGSSKHPAKDSLAQHIIDLTTMIDGDGEEGKSLDDRFDKFYNDAAEEILNAAHRAIDAAIEKFKMNDGHTHIEVTQLMKLFHSSWQELNGAVVKIQEELTEFQKLPAAVCSQQRRAGTQLENLKNKISDIAKKIGEIETPIADANKAFESVINILVSEVRDCRNTARMATSALISTLKHRVKSAFNDVEDAIQKMYVEHMNSNAKNVLKSVSAQFSSIQETITTDMDTGLKGLMSKMRNKFAILTSPSKDLQTCANKVKNFYDSFFTSLKSQSDLSPDRLTPLSSALSVLLSTMHSQRHFSAAVSRKLAELQTQLDTLTPTAFSQASPLLNVLKAGVQAFHGELAKQYVSRYSGMEVGEMVREDKITAYGTKLSKVFLTSLSTLCDDLNPLKKYSVTTWRQERINKDTPIGYFLASRGFEVNSETGKQTGKLRDKPGMLGFHIFKFLDKSRGSDNEHLKKCKEEGNEHDEKVTTAATKSPFGVVGILNCLFRHLHQYYTACHLRHIDRPKSPSSVYQMLVWLTGLPHNRVFPKVSVSDIADLFEKPDAEAGDSNPDGPLVLQTDPDTLPAYPQTIAASTLTTTIHRVCVAAEDILTSILGHGHADGIYAVDFNTNPDGFSYPTAPGACLDMLCDVLNRLYQQLFFLYGQCSNEEPSVSWRDCWYGNQVGGSAWNCNTMQCPDQKGNQIHKQKCNQKCDQTAQCGIKSPLQSFLEDGLPGFLPHSFTKPGCKLTCTLSNHRGIPCRTPMGFADISVTASHRQTGEYLKKVLEGFCGSESAPLTKLCAQLTCLLQKPPQTLGDIFAFYYGYMEKWANDFYGNSPKKNLYTRDAFREAVNDAYFGEPYEHLDPITLVSSSKHTEKHSKGNLCSIANCESGSVAPCGLYVKSMTQDITKYYSAEHKANHLSWIVYITETFCDLLKKLYDDCCKKCGPGGSKCHVKSCAEQCEIKYSDDKKHSLENKSHQHDCKSIINCRDTHPTLYKYGFTFGKTWALNGSRNEARAKRTCRDFCEALKKMLAEGSVLITLRGHIDDFLWAIRFNFSITVLALWLLSLLYLLHIFIIRLDLLHIKSHLHSPSSHRIAAQSLLAAARVNKLNRVFYLQP
ncbi:hypothetical protein, conserved [Babesia bigemina]|uniref:C3H1-type domain-containing protein n=1 Tax=Babesia bigemina TaxID=5866 RepID=A0A061BTP4_BABBI|nr:hypothetical protein, conserved [Babesia bigemina]CDR71859.1 hypothetical protein, conserved [Babesia bigemina]|eukprot:XP_012770802.1 hypothetical protein, conserved [Babesia bigemina]